MGARGRGGRHRKNDARRSGRESGRHDEPPIARRPSGHATGRSASPFITVSAAIVAVASVTAASSVNAGHEVAVPSPPSHDTRSASVALAAASSPLNIPINLLIDAFNVPQYEVDGLNYEAAAFLFTGSWWVSNATNVWGTDPGDPPKYTGAASILLPNPWLSQPVGQILSAIATAELPVNATCGTTLCPPFVPWDTQGAINALLGVTPLPIINNFFTVPLSALYTGYTFDPTAPGQQSFGGYVPTDPFGPGYDLPGTTDGPNGSYLMPWAGQTVNLTTLTSDAWSALVAHLQADPAQNPVRLPTGQEIGRALTNMFAALVVSFDPFTPGMSYCPTCQWPTAITPEGIVGALSAADPGNQLLKAWLDNHAWQNSQGAPGTPATPSTPESVGQQQTAQLVAAKAEVQAPVDDTSQASQQQQRGKHVQLDADPDAIGSIDTASTADASEDTGQTSQSPDATDTTRSFKDRLDDAVARALGTGKGDPPKLVKPDKPDDVNTPDDAKKPDAGTPGDVDKSRDGHEFKGAKTGGTNGSADADKPGDANKSGETKKSGDTNGK